MSRFFPLLLAASVAVPSIAAAASPSASVPSGGVEAFRAYALKHSPLLESRAADWTARRRQVDAAGTLPNPVVSYGVFLRRVETRVGSQRQRFGVLQAIPWPTVLSADVDAARSSVRSSHAAYQAARIEVRRRVSVAYWEAWALDRILLVQRSQKPVLENLLSMVAARLEVGNATLADHGRVAISLSRLTDRIESLKRSRREALSELARRSGLDPSVQPRIAAHAQPLRVPVEGPRALQRRSEDHPRFAALLWAAKTEENRAVQANAKRYPGISIGVDYIDTAASDMDVAESGKDPVLLKLNVRIPLWQGSYRAAAAQRRAQSASILSRLADVRLATHQAIVTYRLRVEDTARRVALYQRTLVPQAESVFGSTMAAYQTGRANMTDVLLAWNDLLELQSAEMRVRADHAKAWANLRAAVGTTIRTRPYRAPKP